MNKKTLTVLTGFGFLIAGAPANADPFAEKCPDIAACAKVVGEMLGQKYIFDADVRGKVQATPNLELTRDNAELLFTNMLYLNGFSRVPLGQPNTFQIARQRDARDSAIPLVKADKNDSPDFPQSWDLMTLQYKAANPEAIEQIARTSRNFMPPNARIVPAELGGTLLITDAAPNLKKLYEIIRDLDQKPSPEMMKRWAEMEKTRRSEMGPKGPRRVLRDADPARKPKPGN